MLKHDISLVESVFYSILAAVSWCISEFAASLPAGVRFAFMLLTLVFVSHVVVYIFYFAAYHSINVYHQFKRAASITPESVMMENARMLTPAQLAVVQKAQVTVNQRILPGNAGPVKYVSANNGTQIPLEFVRDFLEACDEKQLVPVRAYSDSEARVFAVALTDLIIGMGWAIRGSGNQRSTFVENREAVRKFFGI